MEDIEIRLIRPSDKDSLIDFLKHQIPRNGTPVMMSLNLTPDDIEYLAHRKVYEALNIQSDKPMSHLAVDRRTDAIIAVQICYIVHPGDGPHDFESTIPAGPKMQKLIDFWRLMLSGIEELFPPAYSGPYLMGEVTIVDPEYSRFGLLSALVRMTRTRALEKFGCKYDIVLCTSYKSIRAAEKGNYKTLRWIRYEDYCVNGKRVFEFGADSKEKYAKVMMGDLAQMRKARERAKL